MAVAARLWSRRTALVAGWLASLSPLLVWYGQEVRMYALAAAWACGLVWLALVLTEWPRGRPRPAGRLSRPRPALWCAYVALASAALHTHYLVGASALLAANLTAAARLAFAPPVPRRRVGRLAATWLAAQVVAGASLLPWLRLSWPALRDWPAVGSQPGVRELWREAADAMAMGARVPPGADAGALPLLALAGLGLAALLTPRLRAAAAAAAAHATAAPILLTMLALARPAWDAKFLVASAPGFELLAAGGVTVLARRGARRRRAGRRLSVHPGAALAAAALLAAGGYRALALHAMYTDPAYQRDDYRGIARAVAAAAGPDDAVLLNAPTQIEVYGRYHQPALPAYPVPAGRRPPRAATEALLAGLGHRHRDLFAVLWATAESDPDGVVEDWLNRHRYKVDDRWFGNVRLARWSARRDPMTRAWPTGEVPGRGSWVFGSDEIALEALTFGPPAPRPGEIVTMDVAWAVAGDRAPAADYVVFVHLLDAAGRIAAQRDMAPLGGSARTSTWPAGPGNAARLDRIGLAIPGDTPPGRYRLLIGLFDPATGHRLPAALTGGQPRTGDSVVSDAVAVGTLVVAPPLP